MQFHIIFFARTRNLATW